MNLYQSIDGSMQERRNSIANALELRFFALTCRYAIIAIDNIPNIENAPISLCGWKYGSSNNWFNFKFHVVDI